MVSAWRRNGRLGPPAKLSIAPTGDPFRRERLSTWALTVSPDLGSILRYLKMFGDYRPNAYSQEGLGCAYR